MIFLLLAAFLQRASRTIMWRRNNATTTGANEVQMNKVRSWGNQDNSHNGPPPPEPPPPQQGGHYSHSGGASRFDDRDRDRDRPRSSRFDDRSHSSSRFDAPPPPVSMPPMPSGERKKKSRWGTEKVDGGTVPVAITGGVESKDLERFAGTSLWFLLQNNDEMTNTCGNSQPAPRRNQSCLEDRPSRTSRWLSFALSSSYVRSSRSSYQYARNPLPSQARRRTHPNRRTTDAHRPQL